MKRRSLAWLWLLLLIPIAVGAARLRFDVEVLNLLPAQAPVVQGLRLYQQNFSNARELIITVQSGSPENAEAAARGVAEALRGLTNLVSDVTWQQPWLEHPGEAAELVGYMWFNQPPAVFGALTNRLLGPDAARVLVTTRDRLATSLSPAEIGRLSHDPFNLLQVPENNDSGAAFGEGQDMFSSEDGRFRLIFIRSLNELGSYRACRTWLNAIQGKVQSIRSTISPDAVLRYTGRPAFVSEIAGGMERDINSSVAGTLVVIVLLFWWAHRSWRPLLWLVVVLILVLGATLSLGGLFLGPLNVVSAGFAAILLGLGVDYGLVLYQEHRAAPQESASQIRRAVAPSILWSAVTTAGAFFVLNLGGLPGLGQLGSLVGIGVILAGLLMLYLYLPPLASAERKIGGRAQAEVPGRIYFVLAPSAAWIVTGVLVLLAAVILWWRPPVLDHTPDPLRPRRSPAYQAVDEIKSHMKQQREPLWLVVEGRNEREVADRLDKVLPALTAARADGHIEDFNLPANLWPHPHYQQANRQTARLLLKAQEPLRHLALEQGFATNSLGATDAIFDTWRRAADSQQVFWPDNSLSRWLFSKFTARTADSWLALGLVYQPSRPDGRNGADSQSYSWSRALPREGVWLAGWGLLGLAILEVVERDLWRVMAPMAALLLISLWFAFRRVSEMLLSLATLGLSSLCLLAFMSLAGWSWNLLNLMALPLLLGAGVDYSIHMQLALRRHGGDIAATRRIIGRALLLCALTTIAGFGSLVWSSNAGLATVGQVCAAGIGLTFLASVFLLPAWWRGAMGFRGLPASGGFDSPSPISQKPGDSEPSGPSALYRSELWRLGQSAGKHLPWFLSGWLSGAIGLAYWCFNARRREIVANNVLPALGSRSAARGISRRVFQNFAVKLVHLWRYESGLPIESLIGEVRGWDLFLTAQKRRKGVLLLTPHLGNWELGAPLMARKGVELFVITLQEPQKELTELRRASRKRWGIDTLVIGDDSFAFVEVIRRLENGATVALLIDRPPVASATRVELFGRPFMASIAAAELARASGCVLVPVIVPWMPGGYQAEVFPEIPYDRAALGTRQGREQLTQEIIRAFEPLIQQHLAQWYHFVPLWPSSGGSGCAP